MKKSTLSRTITAAIIALGALLCLTACGGGAQSQSENSADTTAASTVLTTTASDESKTTTTTAQTTTVAETTTTAVTTTTVDQTTALAITTTTVSAELNNTVSEYYVDLNEIPNTAEKVDIAPIYASNNPAASAVATFLQCTGTKPTVSEIAEYLSPNASLEEIKSICETYHNQTLQVTEDSFTNLIFYFPKTTIFINENGQYVIVLAADYENMKIYCYVNGEIIPVSETDDLWTQRLTILCY